MKAFKDPLYIRILSGMFFAGAFIWVAVRYFQVDIGVIYVFLIMSIVFVAGLIVLGLVFSVLLRLLRRRSGSGLLDAIRDGDTRVDDTISAESTISKKRAVIDAAETPEGATAQPRDKR